MSRVCTALPLTLALAVSVLLTASCSSSGSAQVRVVHAIPDSAPIDVYVNGTVKFPDISFLGVSPTHPGYTAISAGSDTIAGLSAGAATQIFSATTSLGSGGQYTLVATGFAAGKNVDLLSVSDNNAAPPSGNVTFRVINASPSGPKGVPGAVDVYIQLNPTTAPNGTPAIAALDYTQGSKYISLPNNPNKDTNPPGFTVFVTPTGSLSPLFSEQKNLTAGAVRTLVLTDAQSFPKMNLSFLELSDLN